MNPVVHHPGTPDPVEFRTRQVDALTSTYPGWDFSCRHNPETHREEWQAVLRQPVTAQMRQAGVREAIAAPDVVSLAGALSCQVTYIHNAAATSFFGTAQQ